MKEITLSKSEKSHLELLHTSTKEGKQRDRLKAVLLRSEGWTIPMISQALRIHERTVNRHLTDYKEGKLSTENGGSESRLTEQQTEELIAHLSENTYHYIHEITDYVRRVYGITYSIPGLNKWLHRNNFSYKKPKGHPYKADKQSQDKFVKHYNKLKTTAGKKEPIIFVDSVHPSQATKLSYGWIRTGETKCVCTTASRTRMNIIGGIELGKLKHTIIAEHERINADTIISFLQEIREQHKRKKKIHVILDQAGYHKSKAVQAEAKKLNIKLHYLPPYSPNLNPIERLWKVMNEEVRNNRFFRSSKAFRKAIWNFFDNTLPNIADSLNSRINDNFQKLNMAT